MDMDTVYFFSGFWWFSVNDLRLGPYNSKADATKMEKAYLERIADVGAAHNKKG